jgi:hypothetical protein
LKLNFNFKLKKRPGNLWRKFCAGMRSIAAWPGKLRQKFHKEKPLKADFTPEMEHILNKIIRDTVGTGGAMDQEFLRHIVGVDEEHPIGEPEAREALQSLLKLAIAKRDLINGRIEHSVEYGSLYYRYYAKLQTIYDLNMKTNLRREEMAAAQRDYFFAYNLYNNVRDMTYEPTVTQKHSGASYPPPPPAVPTEGGSTK